MNLMQTLNRSRTQNIERVEWVLSACLLLWFGFTTIPHAWQILNTDFPNYYIAAHLVREHISTSRIYEWVWFQRQQDYVQTGQTFSAMQPLTPFSTLFLWPFASLAPLAAKHCWLILNAALLLVSARMLRRIVSLRWSSIALLIAASYPLQRNLLTGQFYILLLFLIAFGLWMHLRGHRVAAGVAIAVAIGLKIFPLLYVIYFLRKCDWRALAGIITGCLAVAAVSIYAFGWQLNRLYLLQLLPREMRGDSTNPYDLGSASFTVLFHRLFVFEPTLNPHPAIHAAWLLSVLLPIVQLLVLVPLVVLANPRTKDSRQTQLEWSAVLLAALTLSPMPASYHFVLLFLPVAVLAKIFVDEDKRWQLVALIFLFLAIGFPRWPINSGDGWLALLRVPRLYATIALYVLTLRELHPKQQPIGPIAARDTTWIVALTGLAAVGIAVALHSQPKASVYDGRVDLPNEGFSFGQPLATEHGISFIAMQHTGYRDLEEGEQSDLGRRPDELTHAARDARHWTERVSATSQIVSNEPDIPAIENAEQPVVSPDGNWLTYQREDHGRATLWLQALDSSQPGVPITPPDFNILESSFTPNGDIIFSAFDHTGIARLFERGRDGHIAQLLNDEARYPAISPDGEWLVYSQLRHGSWNLRLRNRSTGRTSPVTDNPCNAIQAAWEPDSHTILFASDCGRAVGLTALYRRQIVP
jgi:hypothetical protein